MEDEFYIRFEDKFRGSRLTIKERLRVYLPIIEPLKAMYPDNSVIDLGCGRGEWLELLHENGWQPVGVDKNKRMVDFCIESGFNAVLGDAIEYLQSLATESVSIVSGFHIAEHLPFDLLLAFIKEAHRTLLPGGFLILETPNAENIIVGTASFYIDPTHIRPIPHELLSFVIEYYGFNRTKTLRLQESQELLLSKTTNLISLFSGVSPDYAILAQKGGPPETLAFFNDEFINEHGLTLETLAQRYDSQAISSYQHLSKELEDLRAEVDSLHSGLEAELNDVYNSRSYRITAPFRAIFSNARFLKDRFMDPTRLHRSNAEPEIKTENIAQSLEPNSSEHLQPDYGNHISTKKSLSTDSFRNEPFSLNLQKEPELNLDEIMERIREEVVGNKLNHQFIDGFASSSVKETGLFRLVKKVQMLLKKLPFYRQIYNIALKFKPHIPKYQLQQLTLDNLLKYEDEEFITNAYKAILRRNPDNDGFNNFLALLQSRTLSKTQILGKLRYSPEGRHAGVKIKGLAFKFIASTILRNDRD